VKTTARFELQRLNELKDLFDKTRLIKLWRSLVRQQMRSLDIRDLHDYYDFNLNIETRADAIIERVTTGHYRPSAPLVYRVERKLGVCRHLMVPSPSDALVFQVLTDALYESLIKAQPSKQAYYSRDRHTLKLPHEEVVDGYPWFILWPRFQKEVWGFSKAHKFLVTTDLTNYFDNIGLKELRHIISSLAHTKEVYLDLLFSLVEDLSWKPDYLPVSHKGLPTINIEAIRLLAHSLLFEVDFLLEKRTKNSFVRWMDDINFGVDSREEARVLLGEISDVVKSRGLALNLAKTDVLTGSEAKAHFLFSENERLSKMQVRARKLKSPRARRNLATKLRRELRQHERFSRARNKEKVSKRYLTILGDLQDTRSCSLAIELFRKNSGLRPNVLWLFQKLPFTRATFTHALSLLKSIAEYDDSRLFALVDMLVKWKIPRSSAGARFVKEVAAHLAKFTGTLAWTCHLHFLAKYGAPHEVLTVASKIRGVGISESFPRRQAMAVLPRALGINSATVRSFWTLEISAGASDAASVANNLLEVSKMAFPPKGDKVHAYLFPSTKQKPYPVSKFLILCSLAWSEAQAGKLLKRPIVSEHIDDPWFSHCLTEIHPAWF